MKIDIILNPEYNTNNELDYKKYDCVVTTDTNINTRKIYINENITWSLYYISYVLITSKSTIILAPTCILNLNHLQKALTVTI